MQNKTNSNELKWELKVAIQLAFYERMDGMTFSI